MSIRTRPEIVMGTAPMPSHGQNRREIGVSRADGWAAAMVHHRRNVAQRRGARAEDRIVSSRPEWSDLIASMAIR